MEGSLASVYKETRKRLKSTEAGNILRHSATVKRIDRFYQESTIHHFTVPSDEHVEPWGGTNRAPSPLGYMLSAIGFSINNQVLIHSEVNGVKLDSLETVVTGWFDPKGCLDIRGHNPSLSKITIEFNVTSDSPREKIQKVLEKAASCDPAYQTFRKAAKVEKKLSLVRKTAADHNASQGGHRGK